MISEHALETLIELLGDAMSRLDEAEDNVKYWQGIAGKESLRANKAEGRAMAAEGQPNGSEHE